MLELPRLARLRVMGWPELPLESATSLCGFGWTELRDEDDRTLPSTSSPRYESSSVSEMASSRLSLVSLALSGGKIGSDGVWLLDRENRRACRMTGLTIKSATRDAIEKKGGNDYDGMLWLKIGHSYFGSKGYTDKKIRNERRSQEQVISKKKKEKRYLSVNLRMDRLFGADKPQDRDRVCVCVQLIQSR